MKLFSTKSLAVRSAKHPWIILLIWVVIIAAAVFITSKFLSSALTMDDKPLDNPEYYRGLNLLKKKMPGFDQARETIIVDSSLSVDDPKYAAFVGKLLKEINGLGKDVVGSAFSYYQTKDPTLISKDNKTTIITAFLEGNTRESVENVKSVKKVISRLEKENSDFKVLMVGSASVSQAFQEVSESDIKTGETYGIIVAVVILTIVFGTLVAASIPILLAIVSIVVAVGASALLGQAFELTFFITNIITMMGLAVGIDYSLFIVSRFREERHKGRDKLEAIAITGASANRAVFFSGITVLFSLLGMMVIPHSVFRSLAVGAMLVVVAAMLASLTLLPALLSILGDRINAIKIPYLGKRIANSDEHSFWTRAAKTVMKHPVVSLALTLTLLLGLSSFYLGIDLGSSQGPGALPENTDAFKASIILEKKFPGSRISPTFIVLDSGSKSAPVQKAIKKFQADLMKDKDIGASQVSPNPKNNLTLITVQLRPKSIDKQNAAIDRLRQKHIPNAFKDLDIDILVTGETAGMMDFSRTANDYIPIVFGVVLSLSFILLTVVFRSIVVPIKAIIMNLLSVGAAYGLIVLVFQDGFLADFLGFKQVEVIESWIPLFLFSILFGLSMDYHVFLLSRIRERFAQTGDNTESVAFGLSSTGSIITGAALIMVAVFGGFAAGNLLMFQQMGFGLAVAVFLDATIVRSILVPASMKLLGDRNWYLPSFLQWLPEIKVESEDESEDESEKSDAA